MVISAYCLTGATASGVRAGPGAFGAPHWFPIGARVELPAYGVTGTILDRGPTLDAANRLDRWVPSCDFAWNVWGTRRAYVTIGTVITVAPPADSLAEAPQEEVFPEEES